LIKNQFFIKIIYILLYNGWFLYRRCYIIISKQNTRINGSWNNPKKALKRIINEFYSWMGIKIRLNWKIKT
jgi:hypothetical protein